MGPLSSGLRPSVIAIPLSTRHLRLSLHPPAPRTARRAPRGRRCPTPRACPAQKLGPRTTRWRRWRGQRRRRRRSGPGEGIASRWYGKRHAEAGGETQGGASQPCPRVGAPPLPAFFSGGRAGGRGLGVVAPGSERASAGKGRNPTRVVVSRYKRRQPIVPREGG